MKSATSCAVAMDVQIVRAVLLEVNRIYNHVNDIGAMGNDVAFGIAHAHTMRIREQLLHELLPSARSGPHHGVALVEGWRGTIAHRVEIRPDGTIGRIKFVDPSFFNLPALPVALAGDTIVPDSQLTNKGFNLSYTGNEL